MFRVIRTFKPTWVIAENVYGLLTLESGMVFEHCCLDLEGEGYEVQTFIIPACAVNAPHRRDRVWIVGHAGSSGWGERCGAKSIQSTYSRPEHAGQDVADSTGKRLEKQIMQSGYLSIESQEIGNNWSVEPDVGRVAHGIPQRVDRLKALGNAIVPYVAAMIMQVIKEVER